MKQEQKQALVRRLLQAERLSDVPSWPLSFLRSIQPLLPNLPLRRFLQLTPQQVGLWGTDECLVEPGAPLLGSLCGGQDGFGHVQSPHRKGSHTTFLGSLLLVLGLPATTLPFPLPPPHSLPLPRSSVK